MTNNAPDYEDNLAFEPAKTAGTIEMVTKDGKAVAIRCYIDNQHYFDLALEDAPEKMDWFEAKVWCEEHYCRLPMKHELKFICDNLSTINKMLRNAGGKMLNGTYWSSSESSGSYAWNSYLGDRYGLYSDYKYNYTNLFVRPVFYF
jgi:hypothetical protein